MHSEDVKNWLALFLFYSSLAMILAITLSGCSASRMGL
jgi:hypothetical protein